MRFRDKTQDLDLWVKREFGVAIGDEGERQLTLERNMLQLGHPPNRVDILNFLDGCDERAFDRKVRATIRDREVFLTALEDYVATKRASNRAKDVDDLNRLREQLGALPYEPREF